MSAPSRLKSADPFYANDSCQSEANIERSHTKVDRYQHQPFGLRFLQRPSLTKAQRYAPARSSAIRRGGRTANVTAALIVRRASGAPRSEMKEEAAGRGTFAEGSTRRPVHTPRKPLQRSQPQAERL